MEALEEQVQQVQQTQADPLEPQQKLTSQLEQLCGSILRNGSAGGTSGAGLGSS